MNFASEGYDWQVIHGKLLDNFEKKINMYSKNQKIPSVKDWEIKYPVCLVPFQRRVNYHSFTTELYKIIWFCGKSVVICPPVLFLRKRSRFFRHGSRWVFSLI